MINNAGYFWEEHETLDNMNFDEQLKQIDICAVGPLRVTSALFNKGLLGDGAKAVIITSQAGSAEWRFTQNPEGGDVVVSWRAIASSQATSRPASRPASRREAPRPRSPSPRPSEAPGRLVPFLSKQGRCLQTPCLCTLYHLVPSCSV